MTRSLAALAVTLALGGCASIGNQFDTRSAGLETGSVTLRVENDRLFSMNVFVEGGIGARKLIGTVPPRSRAYMTLSRQIVESGAEIRLIADPMGSTQEVVSESIDLSTSNMIEWRIRSSGSNRLSIM